MSTQAMTISFTTTAFSILMTMTAYPQAVSAILIMKSTTETCWCHTSV